MKSKTYKGIGGTCGVMPYVLEGKSHGIFLPPEELFKSINKLVNTPVVLQSHDAANNIDKNKVGIVTSAYPLDDFSIGIDMQIWDEKAQQYIERGNRELSAGYTANLVQEDSHWYGSPYSYKKSIDEFDHIVVLPEGDARNRVAKILLNSATEESASTLSEASSFVFNIVDSASTSTETTSAMGKRFISIPESQAQFEVDGDVAAYIESLQSSIKQLNTSLSDTNTNLTTQLNDSRATLESTLKEKEEEIANIKARLPKYLAIANKAAKLGVTIDYENFDPLTIMQQALAESYPGIESQSEETVSFLFGNLKEKAQENQAQQAEPQTTVTDSNTTTLKSQVNSVVNKPSGYSASDMAAHLANKRKQAAVK